MSGRVWRTTIRRERASWPLYSATRTCASTPGPSASRSSFFYHHIFLKRFEDLGWLSSKTPEFLRYFTLAKISTFSNQIKARNSLWLSYNFLYTIGRYLPTYLPVPILPSVCTITCTLSYFIYIKMHFSRMFNVCVVQFNNFTWKNRAPSLIN